MNEIDVRKEKLVPASGGGRNYGVDLLRIVAMFYVIVLHVLGRGGALAASENGTGLYALNWLMETWAYCAVNCFALISGFASYSEKERPVRYSNYFMLWLQVVFYGLFVTIAAYFLHNDWVTRRDLIRSFFPVTNGDYWYFTAYTGLFIFIPLLNKVVRHLDKRYLIKTAIILVLVLSCFETLTGKFLMHGGYCFTWLSVLYLLGAIMKKCEIDQKIKSGQAILGIVALVAISWLWMVFGKPFSLAFYTFEPDLLISYTSPTILGIAILHVVLFSRLKLRPMACRLIAFFAPCAFAGYILNCQWMVWEHVMKDRFTYLAQKPLYLIPLHVLGFAAGFLLAAMLIDRVRQWLFRLLHLRKAAEWVETLARRALNAIVK